VKLGTDAFRNLPFAGALVLMVTLAALGAVYWNNVQEQERYLSSRNFRLLSVLANQTQNLLQTRARILMDRVRADSGNGGADRASHRVAFSGDGPWLRVAWHSDQGAGERPVIERRLEAKDVLDEIFGPKLRQGAFDTLALATRDGQVVFAMGRRSTELHVTTLAALTSQTSGTAANMPLVTDTIAEHRVAIAGVAYRMFVQPCCRGDARTTADATTGLVVVGLADADAMRSDALAISPVLVLGGIVLVLAAIVSWAFLKVALVHAQERVTPLDALQLGASSVFGLGLATVLLFTIGAYARLTADVDDQLRTLADRLHDGIAMEMSAAYEQARAMERRLLGSACAAEVMARDRVPRPPSEDPGCVRRLADEYGALDRPYPEFTALALIDRAGLQRVKVSRARGASRRIPVGDRGYFREALAQAVWKVRQCPGGCVLESHWSWTTGKPQVVLSIATDHAALPVAALSIPMRSVIRPVLPSGFEFAVVDASGLVQFHSDTQRNVHENLFLETDQNPRLRSLIAAHGAGIANTSYWGRPYRAYVRPADMPGWSIVTLFDKQPKRGLVLEWAAVSLMLLSAFVILWIVVMLGILRRGAAWVWPDPLRRTRYRLLGFVFFGLIAAFAVVAALRGPTATLYAGAALPCLGWALAIAVLAARPPGVQRVEGWWELHRDYRLMGALFLVLSAIVPAAAAVVFSHDLHIESFVKHRHLSLIRAVEARDAWRLDDARHPLRGIGVYDGVFYGTTISRHRRTEAGVQVRGVEHQHDVVHSLVEEYLPYYTSSSIEMRELLHDAAEDGSWTSERGADGRLRVRAASRDPAVEYRVTSAVPSLTSFPAFTGDGQLVVVSLIALLLLPALAGCASWIVNYLLRHVFLSDVVEPMWATGRLVGSVGQHLAWLCDCPDTVAKQLKGATLLRLTPVIHSADPVTAWRQARVTIAEAGPGRAIVIADLDDSLDDSEAMSRRLALVEELVGDPRHTVVLLSRHPLGALADSARDLASGTSTERWERLMDRFIPIDRREQPETVRGGFAVTLEPPLASGWRRLLRRVLPGSWLRQRALGWRHALLLEEGRPHRALRRICADLFESESFQSGSLTREQILDEIEERAWPFYQGEWQSCTPEERVVLEHVARHGLANVASRRIVRQLLVKGLLRKDPELRPMNQTFRRFVLAPERRHEVAALEDQCAPSLWDRLRIPLGVGALAGVVFLVTTQREMFDATVTVAAGVTTAVPTLLRLTTVLTQLGARNATVPRANV
jgi:hypothetical protein